MSDKAYLPALERVKELKSQRDRLREALEDVTQAAQQEGLHMAGWKECIDKAAAALAETEEDSE